MSIYRGAGGASDATDDATVNAVAGYASDAAASATSAATSATNAATSATAANTSVTSATTQASNAATSASSALFNANQANAFRLAAIQQAQAATASANAAAASASNASTSATSANSSMLGAQEYTLDAFAANSSASGHASAAATSAASALAIYGNTTAMNAAVTASQTAATNAATSASSSATSAAEALVYKNDAAGFASDANTAYLAASDEANIATEQANVAVSAANSALAVYGNTTLMNAAVGTAVTAADEAADSAVTATAQAGIATTQASAASASASQAAASADSATAIVTGVASTRPSIRPSLLLAFANTRVLDPRITFTRASTATFYDNDTSAVAEQNLFTYSEQFDNAAWTKTDATVTANATNAPDGTTTADLVLEAATTAVHGVIAGSIATVSGQAYILSAYIKGNGRSFCVLYDSQSGVGKYFAITAGGGGSVLGDYIGAPAGASLTYVGNDWYRCSITVTATSTMRCRIYAADTGTTVSYLGDITKGLFLWGAQLEQRSSVTAYTPTTTEAITNYIPVLQTAASGAARFDCNPVTRESLGLLIEESRTNLLTYSEQVDNAAWSKVTSNVTANSIVAPDGTLTVDKIYDDVTASTVHYVSRSLTGLTNAATYTATVYAKAGEKTGLRINLQGATNATAYYNLSTGVMGTVASGVTATMTSVGNGWYRCSYTRVIDATSAVLFFHLVNPSETVSYTGDGYSGLYIWGAQLEAGAFATSYIPTVASQVTRAADAASMTGTNFSNWFNVAQGAITATCSFNSVAGTGQIVSINDGSTANESYLRQTVGTNQYVYVVNTVTQAGLNVGTATANSDQKLSGAYQTNNFAASANGSSPTTDTLGSIYTFTQMNIGSRGNVTQAINGTIKRLSYYPVRLSNTELQGLTA